MKNKKISIMMITISVLLIITTLGIVINTIRVESLRKSSIYKLANSTSELGGPNLINTDTVEEKNSEGQATGTQDMHELRSELINDDMVSSRSEVDRQNAVEIEEIYVNTSAQQGDEYEELIQYTKLEDVKISFDMDVSKTTGLSKEDFITLVQNMRYDKTGILEKNAGWICICMH